MSDYVRALRERVGTMVLETPTVSILVLDSEMRVLLVRHVEGGVWSTPGGMIEPYETPADAAVRELYEETGLRADLTRIVGVFGGRPCSTVYTNGDCTSWVSTAFEAVRSGGTLRADGIETLEVRFVSRAEAAQLKCAPHVSLMLDALYSGSAQATFQPATWSPDDAPPSP